MKKIYLVRTLCITVSVVLVLGVLFAADRVLRPKYLSVSPEGSLTEEYYDHVAATAHDVLFIGDCEVYESFVPAVLWEEYGISSYVRGSAQQLVWHSYYLLKEALTYETPRVVVFNVLALKYGEPQNEAYNRMTLDGMQWSSVKLEAIRASLTEGESLASYLFPLLRFHDRWRDLTSEDFTYAFSEKPMVSDSGYLMQTAVLPPDPSFDPDIPPPADPTLPEGSMRYLDMMRELCAEQGIALVLVKSPTNSWWYHWYDEWDAQITDYAVAHGISYYNMIDDAEEIGIDWQTDTYDKGIHLNVSGAEKVTRRFGAILDETFDLPDRRKESAYATIWAERAARYEERKNTMKEGN